MKIAILGATGHVAKNLIVGLAHDFELDLVARRPQRVRDFIEKEKLGMGGLRVRRMEEFYFQADYDAVINCIGAGTPEKVRDVGGDIFSLTEQFDNLIIGYMKTHRGCRYINISSGTVHVGGKPDAYRMTKLNAETKHRAFPQLSIVDLRLFSFFSRHIDMTSSYLMADIARAVLGKTELVTNGTDITRDYVSPADLCALVAKCIQSSANVACDAYSSAPTTKSAILAMAQSRFGLKLRTTEAPASSSVAGSNDYVPLDRTARDLFGYAPTMSSLDTIQAELKAMGLA
jgi:nucleoside-diphosphate-sugar epimerase